MDSAELEKLRLRAKQSKPAALPSRTSERSRSRSNNSIALSPIPTSQIAIESVHSGLVQSLEADCIKYRADLKTLQAKLRRYEESSPAKEAAELAAAELLTARLELQELANQLTREQQGHFAAEAEVRRLQAENGTLSKQAADDAAALSVAREAARLAEERLAQQGEARSKELQAEVEQLSGELAAVTAELGTAREQLRAATDQSGRDAAAKTAAEEAVAKLETQLQAVREELAKTQRRAEQFEAAATRSGAAQFAALAKEEEAEARWQRSEEEASRLKEQIAELRADASKFDEERQALLKRVGGAGEKGKKAASEAAALKAELTKQSEVAKTLRTRLSEMQEAERAQQEASAKDAQKQARALERLERRAAALESQVVELTATNKQITLEKELLLQRIGEGAEHGKITSSQAANTAQSGQQAVLSHSNFAKMMSMQQEINQLRAHIEALSCGQVLVVGKRAATQEHPAL